MTLKTTLPVLFSLFVSILYAQHFPGGVPGNTLWLYGDVPEMSSPSKYFNYNPVVSPDDASQVYENQLAEYFSLFVVFQSEAEAEHPVFELHTRKHTITGTNRKVDVEGVFDRARPETGAIISYHSRLRPYTRRNALSFEAFSQRMYQSDGARMLEVIYFPHILSDRDRKKVESYLSLKHGISLIESDYLSAAGDTIWKYDKDGPFQHRVTGIGRDDASSLYQKQSRNSEWDGLVIGLDSIAATNRENPGVLADGLFLLWGDNAGSPVLEPGETYGDKPEKMERVWEIRPVFDGSDDVLSTQLKIDFKYIIPAMDPDPDAEREEMGTDDKIIWLGVAPGYENEFDYHGADYIPEAYIADSSVYFNDIKWTGTEASYFTFVRAPEFFVLSETGTPVCFDEAAAVNLKIMGGEGPFTIWAEGPEGVHEERTDERDFVLETEPGAYTLTVMDNNQKTYTEALIVEPASELSIELAPLWLLDAGGEVTITPTVQGDEYSLEDYTIAWEQDGRVAGTGSWFVATQPGDYRLVVTDKAGCQKHIPFRVEDNSTVFSNLALYPNPVEPYEPFTLAIALEKIGDVDIKLFNVNGQLVKQQRLHGIQQTDYSTFLVTSGAYLAVIETDKGTQTFKIIVK